MTLMDLRISYKMATGDYPLWTTSHDGHRLKQLMLTHLYSLKSVSDIPKKTFIKGVPTSKYGLWLEEKLGNGRILREKFYIESGEHPITNHFSYHWLTSNEVFFTEHSMWLEELILEKENA